MLTGVLEHLLLADWNAAQFCLPWLLLGLLQLTVERNSTGERRESSWLSFVV